MYYVYLDEKLMRVFEDEDDTEAMCYVYELKDMYYRGGDRVLIDVYKKEEDGTLSLVFGEEVI